jgi:C_GCAxxG_C_C family probable redox protein
MARTDGMCGDVTGAVLSLNLLLGRDDASQSKEENYQAIQLFIARFKEKFGGINCTELTGCNLSTEEGVDDYNRNGLHQDCTKFVAEATRLVLELIWG